MNATTIDAPRAKAAAKRTRPAPAPAAVAATNYASLFSSLFEVIEAAWAIDDMAYPTDACILLKMAKDIAHDSRSMGLDEIGVQSAAYDIAALLKAVTSMPDQSRNGMLEPAYPLLAILAEDPDVMDREPWTYGTRSPAPGTKKAQFKRLQELLRAAGMVDSGEIRSGDSIRLLMTAADLAYDVWSGRREDPDLSDAERQDTAYDIAALVSASRRVPADPEPAERKPYLDEAIAILQDLSDDRRVVERPALGPFSAERQELTRVAVLEIMGLMKMATTFENATYGDDSSAKLGLFARVSMLTEIVHFSAALGGHDDEDTGCPPLAELKRRFEGAYR